MISRDKTPGWFLAVIILVGLPVFQFPMLLNSCPPESPDRLMVWIYPFYVVAAGWLAYICYPRRQAMAWILLALMILTHVGMWMLDTV
ncbi:MAG: hypothetical protein J1E38_01080 [Paramuribaculum sp.]|nr:hypothetical protein [Paramuribaculum sp.]